MGELIIRTFDPARVRVLPDQPRKRFRGIDDLAASMAEVGQLQAGIVTLVADNPAFDAQLLDGERRLRACRLLDVTFRAEVKDTNDPVEMFAASFAANFGRQDHDPVEIAEALDRLRTAGRTNEQMARIAGRTAGWVMVHLSLLRLHADTHAMMIPTDDAPPRLSMRLARLLLDLHPEDERKLAQQIVAGEMSFPAARRLVHAHKNRCAASKVRRRHHRSISELSRVIAEASDRFGVYADMSGPDLSRLIDTLDVDAKLNMASGFRELAEDAAGLADAIERRMPSATQGRHR